MMANEEVQQKEDEEVQTKEEDEVQKQSEEESIQKQPEENDIQQKLIPERDTGEASVQRKGTETSNASDVSPIQRKDDEIQEKEEEIQEKEDEEVQRSSSVDTGDTSNLENNLQSSKGGGSPMDDSTRSQMESGFGADFSGVRIHNDSNAVQMNKDLGAQAFANGNDIYFNEGKYNPSSKDGQHLLAHELTHTIQQGASPQANVQKATDAAQPEDVPATKPTTPIDISHRLNLTDAWSKYLDEQYASGNRKFEVDVKIGERYSGTIELSKKSGTAEGELAKYEITKGTEKNFLNINGWGFLQPLRDAGIDPVLVLNKFGDEQQTTGFLSVAVKGIAVGNAKGFIDSLNENLDKMGFLGIEPITITDGFENTFEQGRLIFKVGAMTTVVDGFLEAGGGLGITGDTFTFNVNAKVDVAGLASGELMLARGESGKLSGKLDIEAEIANVNAKLMVEYIEGAVTIQGTGKIQSEKFSGEITLLVTDAVKSKQMMNAALGVEAMDTEKDEAGTPAAKPAPKTKENQVLAGWGEVTANITPWLSGTAKVGIDSEGHVTIVGEITVPDDVELMEQRGKKVDLFKVEIRAGYGIPLVGQVFLFASIGMFMNAGFGPLVLKNVGFKGTYSTDPSVLQEFEITGTLNINAFAIIGLEAEAGVGVTILGHDVKAGVNVTAAAGLRAYAEATPTLEYKEQQSPQGGKVGESRLKGHFEAAAQLFMQLSGSLFYELDSPWWSPAPDGREDYPLGEVQYPIGDSMGIGADMDWLIGSPEIPELKFSPVEFDPDKFTADVMADPPPGKKGKSEENKPGKWEDKNKPAEKKDPPEQKDGKGIEGSDKKKEDLKKLPDQQKYMRSLDEMSKLEKADPKPTLEVVKAKASKVKSKYGIDSITVKDKKDQAEISVKHKKDNNKNNILKVPLMSAAERYKLLKKAMDDLKVRNKKAGGENGTITQADAQKLITDWKKAHPVVEEVRVVDGEKTWDYFINIGDKSNTEKGLVKGENAGSADGEVTHEFSINGEKHTFKIILGKGAPSFLMASNKFTDLLTKIDAFIGQLRSGEKQPYIDREKTEQFIADLGGFREIIKASEKKFQDAMGKGLMNNSQAEFDQMMKAEMTSHAQHINTLFKKHKVQELDDLVLDLLGLPQEIEKLKAVLEQVEKHIYNDNSVGDGHSVSALAAENYMGWLAIHIDNIIKKENLIEVADLEVLGKKKSAAKKKVLELARKKSFDRIPKVDNEIIERKKNIPERDKFVKAEVDSFVSQMNNQLEVHIEDLRTGTPSEATFDQIKSIIESLSYDIDGTSTPLELSVDDESMNKLKGMIGDFVQYALIKDSIKGKVYNAPKPQVHQKKVLGQSEGMGKLMDTLQNIDNIIKDHVIPNSDDAEHYEKRLTDAINAVKLNQTFTEDGKKVKKLTTDFYTRGNDLLAEMVTVEDALSDNAKLEAYLKSKPYGDATLFELFTGEVDKTKSHPDFAKVSLALEKVYKVIYGDEQSVRDFNNQ
ncbi:MAG: DUF4157 domain-containing protein [Flavobacteriales bacterium]|nr:DUF4157 domain-containing protein [Flavobacteriales bacterium]